MKKSLIHPLLFLGISAIPALRAGDPVPAQPPATVDLLKTPGELFEKLDTDRNGSLSREEFLKASSASAQEAAAPAKAPANLAPDGVSPAAPVPSAPPPVAVPANPVPAAEADAGKPKP